MNSPFSVEAAKAAVGRPEIQTSKDDAQRIRRLYRLLFERLPDADELAAGLAYVKDGALSPVASPRGAWSYGYGGIDPITRRVTSFTRLGVFKEGSYRVSDAFPDPVLGYLMLNEAENGHPGHDLNHAVIRRWTAPADMTIQITGELAHRQTQGDGVHSSVISSRLGPLGSWDAHNGATNTDVAAFTVSKGDTVDFVVDPETASDAYDAFSWGPGDYDR